MKKIGIVGFGRFGQLLASLSDTYFDVHIVEQDKERQSFVANEGYKLLNFNDLDSMDFIFLAVPISSFEETVMRLAPLVARKNVIIDLCSVKVYPTKIMKKYLGDAQLLATHPMFGPDSAKKGLLGLQVAICPITIEPSNLRIITDFWSSLGVNVIETTPEDHDQDTVYSQAFTYSIAKIINGMDLPDITLRTRSFSAIHEVAILSARDTEQLFHDMLFYNPYFLKMKAELETSMAATREILNEVADEQRSSGQQAT